MTIKAEISNYYEDLVVELIVDEYSGRELTSDEFNDLACLALNKLPARYYRHSVDMAFFLSGSELEKMKQEVAAAVADAAKHILSHRQDRD